jgi:hypothetical protein
MATAKGFLTVNERYPLVSVRVSRDMAALIRREADRIGCSRPELLRRAFIAHLADSLLTKRGRALVTATGRKHRVTYTIPELDPELPVSIHSAMTLRNATTLSGQCPVCGVGPEVESVEAHVTDSRVLEEGGVVAAFRPSKSPARRAHPSAQRTATTVRNSWATATVVYRHPNTCPANGGRAA